MNENSGMCRVKATDLVRLDCTSIQFWDLLLLHSEQGIPWVDASHRTRLLWHLSQAVVRFRRGGMEACAGAASEASG